MASGAKSQLRMASGARGWMTWTRAGSTWRSETSWCLVKAETASLRLVFSIVILVLGLQMLYKGIWGNL